MDEEENPIDSPLFDFLNACLRHKWELVIFEAAHAIINMKKVTAREINPAVSVLELFCSSQKAALRFAAVRTLNKVNPCTSDPSETLLILKQGRSAKLFLVTLFYF